MDLLLINLKMLGAHKGDLRKLPEYVRLTSRACGVVIPPSYPVLGDDAFRTGTGVHAAEGVFPVLVVEREEGGAQHCQRDYLTLGCATMWSWFEDKLLRA